MHTTSKSAEITLVRVFDAPIEIVWGAWSKLDEITQWWGSRGFSITTESREFCPGGTWKYTMHGPGGVEFINVSKYLEIDEKKNWSTTTVVATRTSLFSEAQLFLKNLATKPKWL